jgi:hypothetical protein
MHWIYAHLIGDYLLQTDWMAAEKKKSWWACLIHVATYMLPFAFCNMALWQLALIAVEHYAQDRTSFVLWFMRAKGSAKFTEPPLGPWSIILTDNVLHILWMAAVAGMMR